MSESPDKQDSRGRGTADTRKERIPFGVQQSRLSVANQDPNFVYRWVNDVPGRIQRAIDGGYEFVEADSSTKVGSGSADGNSDVGSRVSRIVGKHEGDKPTRAYLMRIKREWYEQDQRQKQGVVDEIDAAIRRGDAHKSGDDKRYVPSEGISVRTPLSRSKAA